MFDRVMKTSGGIIFCQSLDKSSLLLMIDSQKNTNITTELNWKLLTKVIKRPSKETWVWIDSVFKKRSASTFNLMTDSVKRVKVQAL
jgi:hypothetical protein